MKERKISNIINYIILFAITITLSAHFYISFAEENKEPSFSIKAIYSSNIKPEEGDIFEITYAVNGDTSGDSATIKVDTSTFANKYLDVNLPEGEYCVLDLKYLGNNQKIIEEGYGIETYFNADTNGGGLLYLAIGQIETESLEKTYADVKIFDAQHDEQGNFVKYDVASDGEPEKWENGEMPELPKAENYSEEETESDTEISNDATTEETTEKTTEENKKDKKDKEDEPNTTRNTIVLIIVIGFCILTVILYIKKKKEEREK